MCRTACGKVVQSLSGATPSTARRVFPQLADSSLHSRAFLLDALQTLLLHAALEPEAFDSISIPLNHSELVSHTFHSRNSKKNLNG